MPEVQATLGWSLQQFIRRLRTGPFDNPGAFYDEHKRTELRYLQYMFRLLTTRRTTQLRALQAQLREFDNHASPTTTPPKRLAVIREQIKALQQRRTQSAAWNHFDREITQSERATKYFFRPPAPILHRISIPSNSMSRRHHDYRSTANGPRTL